MSGVRISPAAPLYFIGVFMKYECQVCNHIHDEEVDGKFEDLPMFYLCPSCGCHKDEFVPLEQA